MCVHLQAPASGQATPALAPELLVAHSPVLLFTAQQQAAASELTQLVQAMGGVSAIQDLPKNTDSTHTDKTDAPASVFVADLGAWLSYMSDVCGDSGQTDTEQAQDMALLGRNLLLHCVRRGAVELAQMLVSAMLQASGDGGADAGAGWFLAAAQPAARTVGGQPAVVTPLLHAAMASGSADMLEKVLR